MSAGEGRRDLFSPWPSLPAALAVALGGQVLLLTGLAILGSILYLAAGLLLALGRRDGTRQPPKEDLSSRGAAALLLVILIAAFFLRRIEIGSIPWGLNNDEGIEGLIACRFLSG